MEIPEQFLCPITLELMEEPVTCEDGNTYEKNAILEYLSKKSVSPLTNQPIGKMTIPNRVLKELIEEFKLKRNKQLN